MCNFIATSNIVVVGWRNEVRLAAVCHAVLDALLEEVGRLVGAERDADVQRAARAAVLVLRRLKSCFIFSVQRLFGLQMKTEC